MGSICSASYANLCLGNFESKYIYTLIRWNYSLCTRYTDDIFFGWQGTKDEHKSLFKEINKIHNSIKFDTSYSFEEINFLDTLIYKDKKCKLQTKLYRKLTDRISILHNKSEHPSSTKTRAIYSHALRIKRICSEECGMLKQFVFLNKKLLLRGYDEKVKYENIARTNTVKREELLRQDGIQSKESFYYYVLQNAP